MNERIKLRKLGQCDLTLSPVGLGCWQFSKGKGMSGRYWKSIGDGQILGVVDKSLKSGVNWFDTAEYYGNGESELALSLALQTLNINKENVVIATKWWPFLRTAGSIVKTIDQRLEALGVSSIDLYQIHVPLSFSSRSAEMRAMASLVEQGKVRSIGLSNYSAAAMRTAHKELAKFGIPLASNQVEYNLLNRNIESNGILKTAKELGISIIAYSPIAQGLLSGKYQDNPEQISNVRLFRRIYKLFNSRLVARCQPIVDCLRKISEKYNATPAQVAINWVIHNQGDIVIAVAGASKPEHASQNAKAMTFRLSDEDMMELDEISQLYFG